MWVPPIWLGAGPGPGHGVLGLGCALLAAGVVAAMVAGSREGRDRRLEEQQWQRACQAGWVAGRALVGELRSGRLPAPLTVWGLVLGEGERAYLDVPVVCSRFAGGSGVYPGSSSMYLGGGGAGVAFAAACVMLSEEVDRSRARRDAQPRWRDHEHCRAILTSHRLLVASGQQWHSFAWSRVTAFYPEPGAGQVVLELGAGCRPLRLRGADIPVVAAWLCWAIHGPDALATHPGLAAMR